MTFDVFIFMPLIVVALVLLGVWLILKTILSKHTLYRRERAFFKDYSGYSLQVKTLRTINSAAKCKKCRDMIETRSSDGVVWCSCKEIFIDNSYAFHIVGAKNLSNVVDFSIISVDKFTIPKK